MRELIIANIEQDGALDYVFECAKAKDKLSMSYAEWLAELSDEAVLAAYDRVQRAYRH